MPFFFSMEIRSLTAIIKLWKCVDEFMFLLPEINQKKDAEIVAGKIINSFHRVFISYDSIIKWREQRMSDIGWTIIVTRSKWSQIIFMDFS
jgi:hypothetical protein